MAGLAAQRAALIVQPGSDNNIDLRLRRIEAFEAIRQLIATYAVGADRKNDPEILGPLFSDEATWEADGITRLVGRDAIAKGLSGLANDFITWSLHYMISPLITVDESAQGAVCRWYLWELCTMKQQNDEASDTWYGGWYDSRLSVHDGQWLFDWVRLDPRLASANDVPWHGKVTNDDEAIPSLSKN
ncbi:nuclear transport factor 2 family protein [Parasphingorhabdus sp.]|uniref:nuclear transport factor 2 family protein n=1 Tax=Parasphingorhabdus sp. TaxID=2709688 RepID=UPI003A8CB373